MRVVSGDEAGVADVTGLSSGGGAGGLLDHDWICDFELDGSLCSSVRCQGLGFICQVARSDSIEDYASDSDYNPCDEFEGLELPDSSSVTDLSRSEMDGCSCDRRLVGPLYSHKCVLGRFD